MQNLTYFIISLIIFVATLFLVIVKPRNIPIGYSALFGAFLTVIFGISTLKTIETVWDITCNATFTFVSVIIMTLIFDEAGFLNILLKKISRLASGNLKKFIVFTMLLEAGISAVFANDGAALVMTHIILHFLKQSGIEKSKIAFLIATELIADTASLPLVVSNLVNIVSATYFNISFIDYAKIMILPYIVSTLVTIGVVRSTIDGNCTIKNYDVNIKDRFILNLAIPFIVLIIIAYSVTSIANIPDSFIAVPSAVILSIVAKFRKIDIKGIIKSAPWQILIFSLGMYIVIFGMGKEGLTSILESIYIIFMHFPLPITIIFSGFFSAALAAIMNNMPSVMINALAIHNVPSNTPLIYANAIGNDIGPKFTPIGSLATLL